jgi:hypothetical protein
VKRALAILIALTACGPELDPYEPEPGGSTGYAEGSESGSDDESGFELPAPPDAGTDEPPPIPPWDPSAETCSELCAPARCLHINDDPWGCDEPLADYGDPLYCVCDDRPPR